jgi:hypothetical protein
MIFFVGNIALLAVLSIFFCWKRYDQHLQTRRHGTLRQRIAYLLWVVAQHNDDNPSNPNICSKAI